jgi:hypothetical protein
MRNSQRSLVRLVRFVGRSIRVRTCVLSFRCVSSAVVLLGLVILRRSADEGPERKCPTAVHAPNVSEAIASYSEQVRRLHVEDT